MNKFDHFLLNEDATIKEAFATIDKGALKIAVIIDKNKRL